MSRVVNVSNYAIGICNVGTIYFPDEIDCTEGIVIYVDSKKDCRVTIVDRNNPGKPVTEIEVKGIE